MSAARIISLACLLLTPSVAAAQPPYQLPEIEPPTARRDAAGNPMISNCQVQLVDSVELPAPEAGVLIYQGVKEGARVEAEDVIAKIDTRMQEMEMKIATYEYHAAMKRANDDIEIRYARKAQEVAQAELDEVEGVRAKYEKAISDPQYRKAKLEADRSLLAIDKAANDLKLAMLEAHVAKGKVDASKLAIDRRTVRAPFDGQVIKVHRRQQEWVNPGDTILQLIRMDTLQVEAHIELQDFSPAEVAGCEVTLEAETTKDRVERVTGRVVNINPVLRTGNESQRMVVRAEIANRTRDGFWIVMPNMRAKMTIHLGTGGVVNSRRTAPESTR